MTIAEWTILRQFRIYQVRPAEMLFVTARDCRVTGRTFLSAMRRLVDKGLVIKEHPKEAYSLTPAGYEATRSREFPTLAKRRPDGPHESAARSCAMQRITP